MRRVQILAGVVSALLVAGIAVAASGGGGQAPRSPQSSDGSGNLDRFATLSFGTAGAESALTAEAKVPEGHPLTAPGDATEGAVPVLPVSEYRTPNGWLLRPAGEQVQMLRAPTGVTVSPDGNQVFVVNSSLSHEDLAVVDASTLATTFAQATDLYMGVAVDDDGNVWASGGNRNKVWQYKEAAGTAVGVRQQGVFPAPAPGMGIPASGYPGNMTLSEDGRLFVAGNLSVPQSVGGGQCPHAADGDSICSLVTIIDVADPLAPAPATRSFRVGRDAYGIALHPNGDRLYVSNWADETAGGATTGSISVVDVSSAGNEHEIGTVPTGAHPTGLALNSSGDRLAVANSADDTITFVSLDGNGDPTGAPVTVHVDTAADAPRGATPLSAAFTPDGQFLLVGNAGQNVLVVLDGRTGAPIPRTVKVGHGPNASTVNSPHTYIPTAWYPSALTAADKPGDEKGSRIYVTNLKGMGAGEGFNFHFEPANGRVQGTLSVIDLHEKPNKLNKDLDRWTATVLENNNWADLFDEELASAAENPCTPAPLPDGATVGSQLLCDQWNGEGVDPTALHVVYIVKENKTFDQFFGDIKPSLPGADADPKWLLYGEATTTNQHNLARRYAVSDNFWADSEQSTTGHSWTSAGYATEYNEITWNTEYDEGLRGNRWGGCFEYWRIPFNNQCDAEVREEEGELFEPEERFVDLLAEHDEDTGLSFRIYSDDVEADSEAAESQIPPGMWGLGPNAVHHGRDLDFPDTDRANIFLTGKTISNAWGIDSGPPPPSFGQEIALSPADREKYSLAAWTEQYDECVAGGGSDDECQRAMPNFLYMALPVDHTLGFNPMSPTPASMVADNDHATGLVIEGLSKSPFWKNTLVLITEDDTQAAGDHVDSHRTFLLTAGGLARPHGPDGNASHQGGSFPSVLKTVEVLLGIQEPLTIYDRAAVPLHDLVVDEPGQGDLGEYEAVKPPTPFLRNPEPGEGSELDTTLALISSQLDWRLDRSDPYVLRDLLYAGLRGWPLPEETARLADE